MVRPRETRSTFTRPATTHRGGVLFEVVLSIALFAGAAAFALGTVRSAFVKLDQTQRKQQAIDLARSKLAELEAGLISLADLRGGASQQGMLTSGESRADALKPHSGPSATDWAFDVEVHRAPFAELSLVVLTVRETVAGLDSAESAENVSYTLRQLVKLRDIEPNEYASDEISKAAGHD
jgi:hypothetical protein